MCNMSMPVVFTIYIIFSFFNRKWIRILSHTASFMRSNMPTSGLKDLNVSAVNLLSPLQQVLLHYRMIVSFIKTEILHSNHCRIVFLHFRLDCDDASGGFKAGH